MSYSAVPLIAALIQVKDGGPTFIPHAVCDRRPSPSVSCWCERSVVIAFLVSLCAPIKHRLWNSQALHCLYCFIGWSIIHFVMRHLMHISSSVHSAWGITVVQVRLLCSLSWSAARSVSVPLTCLTLCWTGWMSILHSEQMLMNAS